MVFGDWVRCFCIDKVVRPCLRTCNPTNVVRIVLSSCPEQRRVFTLKNNIHSQSKFCVVNFVYDETNKNLYHCKKINFGYSERITHQYGTEIGGWFSVSKETEWKITNLPLNIDYISGK